MLKFGWSRKDLGIDGPVGITGQLYERISQGVYDEVTLTALAIDDGEQVSILMSGDLIHIADGLIHDVREAVRAKNPEIPTDRILFNATHTHTSPRYMLRNELDYDKAPHGEVDYIKPEVYRRILVERASDAVVEAYESRGEGSYSYGYGYAVVGHHRRPIYFGEGGEIAFAKMYGKTNDPAFAGYEGAVDHTAYFVFVFDRDDRLTGAIVNVPCPAQCSEHESLLSGDYWVQVRALLRQRYGDIYVLPQCASAGDLSPRTLHAEAAKTRKYALKYEGVKPPALKNPEEIFNRMEIAERIVRAFDDTYAWASRERIRDAKLGHTVRRMRLEARRVTDAEYESAVGQLRTLQASGMVSTDDKLHDFKENTTLSTKLAWQEEIIERYRERREFYEPEIHVISLGEIAFVSFPFELYISYQHRIQARSPFVQTFAVQLAARVDAAGYLCTPAAERNGSYSSTVYSCQVSPKGGDTLVEEAVKELNHLFDYQSTNRRN